MGDGARVAIVGCGRIAGGYNDEDETAVLTHAVAYRRLGAELVACVDANAERAERFAQRWEVPEHGTDPASLVERARAEVVSVCTPPEGRHELVRTLLDVPSVRALFVEKPLAQGAAAAAEILELAAERGRPVVVDYFRAFDPCYRELEERARSGALGAFRTGTARYYGDAVANASHLLERAIATLGGPSAWRRLGGRPEAPLFEVDRVVFLPSEYVAYASIELDLLFEERRVRVLDGERRIELFRAAPDPLYPDFATLVPNRWDGPTPTPESILHAAAAALAAARGEDVEWWELLERAVTVTRILDEVTQV